jgi:hypothetical protein
MKVQNILSRLKIGPTDRFLWAPYLASGSIKGDKLH